MRITPKIYETKLHKIWLSQDFKSQLQTLSGEDVAVLDTGALNEDTAGPDFKNARVRIGNLVYVGDIEIDCDYGNWKNHGHNIDNKHNKVILHASLTNKSNQHYVYTKDGRRVPTICLSHYIDTSMFSQLENNAEQETDNNKIRCAHLAGDINVHIKKKFIASLGMERFQKKCSRIQYRYKELLYLKMMKLKEPVIHYDMKEDLDRKEFKKEEYRSADIWQQVLYEFVFEALGYSKNKSIMLRLAQSADIQFFKKLGNDDDTMNRIECALFNISGLIPGNNETNLKSDSSYVIKLLNDWDIIKRIYDGLLFNNSDWQYFKLRPQNFPTIRIAGGLVFLESLLFDNLVSSIVKKFREIRNLNVLINSIRSLFVIKSRGFWQHHYVFEQRSKDDIKYFVGASRADEIVVNVILPFFAAYFECFGEEELAKKVLKVYNIYDQRSENKIVREVAEALSVEYFLKKTVLTQGMLELFRNFCSKKRCLECEIGKIIFN
ncbi:MAG: DUF2851 family protein [Melioribacteraceae bacterium]|nr:DUF2851 family protein [Melioribacteraceae bacterium]